jgi:hypothetical protein
MSSQKTAEARIMVLRLRPAGQQILQHFQSIRGIAGGVAGLSRDDTRVT